MDVTVVSKTTRKNKKGTDGNRRIIAETIEISSGEDEAQSVSLMNIGRLQQKVRSLQKVRLGFDCTSTPFSNQV